jgi:hypothetical protein
MEKVTSARCQSIHSMTATTPARVTMSATMADRPLVKASLTASTSFSTRVISRPTGFLSKNRASRRTTWANSAARRSWVTRCPVRCMRYASAIRST